MSVFEELLTIPPNLQAILDENDTSLKKQLSELFSPLQRFIESGDRSILIKEFEKENIQPIDVSSQKKTRQRKPTVLDEITENSIQFENVKVKQEKLSIASAESTCSGVSGTFLKEISPKAKATGKKPRQKKPSVSETSDGIGNVKVKVEKISFVADSEPESTVTSETNMTDVDIVIKTEEMPAPRKLPPRKKKNKPEAQEASKRSTRASQRRKESDVVIQNATIVKIDITDIDSDTQSEKESLVVPEKLAPPSMRATRSKMRQKKVAEESQSDSEKVENSEPEIKKVRSTRTKPIRQNKRNRSNSSGEESETTKKDQKKKSQSSTSSESEENRSAHTVYEDAVSTVEGEPATHVDATFVAAQAPILDRTVVVGEPKVVQPDARPKTPPCPRSRKQAKEIFSPFDRTPLKKKVEAFEKLEAAAMQETGPQSTKSKLRSEATDSSGRPKSKLLTPFTSKFMPKTCSTNKISKLLPSSKLDRSSSNESTFSVKSLSALKSSQAEFREREKRRIEKEREALKKREAILLAQMEEKKKRREEKQLKAQLQREIMEKDKQKQLELQQRRDEEKFKQAIAEKEEKLQKQKEEAEKKRLIAKKKAQLIKQQEEREARMAAEKEAKLAAYHTAKLGAERVDSAREANRIRAQQTDRSALPLYMKNKPPLLPTDDCYDSDSSEYQADYDVPEWATERILTNSLTLQNAVPENLKNTFFCRQTHTPDLREIFELIDPKKLKRTSSAVWKKPPRYTLFSVTSIVQFSDDEEVNV